MSHGSVTKSPAKLGVTLLRNRSKAGLCTGEHWVFTPGVLGYKIIKWPGSCAGAQRYQITSSPGSCAGAWWVHNQQSWFMHWCMVGAPPAKLAHVVGWRLQNHQPPWLVCWCMVGAPLAKLAHALGWRLQNHQHPWLMRQCTVDAWASIAGWCAGLGITKLPAPLAHALG